MNVFGIALITLLSFIGLRALITGFVVGETFFIVIGLLLFIMVFLRLVKYLKIKFQTLLKIKNVVFE